MDSNTLAAAFLWLRNHVDVGDPSKKDQVIAVADQVLKSWSHEHPNTADYTKFRETFL